jgi:hypothetical protein
MLTSRSVLPRTAPKNLVIPSYPRQLAMIMCPYCHASHVPNTVFCDECGECLLEDNVHETDLDLQQNLNGVLSRPTPTPIYPANAQPLAIRLKIGTNQREIEMPLDRVIHIGRISPGSNTFPEIDLSKEVGSDRTVSRRHARILKQGNKVVIEDMNSVNGTFVNGKKLDPYLPESLRDGDLLRLGRVPIKIKILKIPSP